MDAVELVVNVPATVRPGAYLRFYGSAAGGPIDFDNPISGPIPVYPPGTAEYAHGTTGRGMGLHAGGMGLTGHAAGLHGISPRGMGVNVVKWRGGQYYGPYGGSKVFTFAAKLYDRDGRVSASNPSAAQQIQIVINSSPSPAADLQPSGLSGGALLFTLTPSRSL